MRARTESKRNRRDFISGGLVGCLALSYDVTAKGAQVEESKFPNKNTITIDNLEYTIATNKLEYTIGEQVVIDRLIRNIGNEKIVLETFQDPEFNILVQKYGITIWQQQFNFNQFSPGVSINPEEVLLNPLTSSRKATDPYKWDMKREGVLTPAGNYNVVGVVYAPNGTDIAVPIKINEPR